VKNQKKLFLALIAVLAIGLMVTGCKTEPPDTSTEPTTKSENLVTEAHIRAAIGWGIDEDSIEKVGEGKYEVSGKVTEIEADDPGEDPTYAIVLAINAQGGEENPSLYFKGADRYAIDIDFPAGEVTPIEGLGGFAHGLGRIAQIGTAEDGGYTQNHAWTSEYEDLEGAVGAISIVRDLQKKKDGTNATGADNEKGDYHILSIALFFDAADVGKTYKFTISNVEVGGEEIAPEIPVIDTAASKLVSRPYILETDPSEVSALEIAVVTNGFSEEYDYQWYYTLDDGEDVAIADNDDEEYGKTATFTPPVDELGEYVYWCVVSFFDQKATSAEVTISVVETLPLSIIEVTGNTEYTVGDSAFTPLTVTPYGGEKPYSFQWYLAASSTVDTDEDTELTDATAASYTPGDADNDEFNTIAEGDFYYYVLVTDSADKPDTVPSDVIKVSVVEGVLALTLTKTGFEDAVYELDTDTVTPLTITEVEGGGAGAEYEYQWYKFAAGSDTPPEPIATATTASFTPPVDTAGILIYYVRVSVKDSAPEVYVETVGVKIEVWDPAVTVTGIEDKTYYVGDNDNHSGLMLEVTASGGGPSATPVSYTYAWYYSTDDDVDAADKVVRTGNSANEAKYLPGTHEDDTFNTDATGTFYYYAVVTVTGSNPAVTGTSRVAKVSVEPIPDLEFITDLNDSEPIEAKAGDTDEAPTLTVGTTGGFSPHQFSGEDDDTPLLYYWYANTTGTVNTASDTKLPNAIYKASYKLGTDENDPFKTATAGQKFYYYVVVIVGDTSPVVSITSKVVTIEIVAP